MNLTPLQKVEAAVPGGLGKGTKKSSGMSYKVSSPLRSDSDPSVCITETKPGGHVLVYDHGDGRGRDATPDIVAEWGLLLSDLCEGDAGGGDGFTPEVASQRFRLPLDFLVDDLGLRGQGGKYENCLYIPYYHQDGTPARPRLRPLGKKPFWGDGDRSEQEPYGLNRMDGWTWLVLCEGESDCWVQWRVGVQAIGIPGNTMFHLLKREHLEGVDTVFVVREDDAGGGESFKENAVERLGRLRFEGAVVHVDMRDFDAKDPADLFKRDPDSFGAKWKAGLTKAHEEVLEKKQDALIIPGVIVGDVAREKIKWLWPGYLAHGKITIFDGDPSKGKSLIYLNWASRITRGSQWPDGKSIYEPSNIVVVTTEDSVADTIRGRLEEAGADVRRVKVITTVPDGEGPGRILTIPRDAEALMATAKAFGACLVVIDPLYAHFDAGINSYVDADVRRALAPLMEAAERYGIAILLVRHLTKGGTGNALRRGGGSIGIIGAARIGLIVGEDPADDQKSILAVSKVNIGKYAPSLAYHIESSANDEDVGIVKWDGISPLTANELFGGARIATKTEGAIEWLVDILRGGEIASKDIVKRAEAIGFSEKTIFRAKKAMSPDAEGPTVRARKSGMEDGWFWSIEDLPVNGQHSGDGADTEPSDMFAGYSGDGTEAP